MRKPLVALLVHRASLGSLPAHREAADSPPRALTRSRRTSADTSARCRSSSGRIHSNPERSMAHSLLRPASPRRRAAVRAGMLLSVAVAGCVASAPREATVPATTSPPATGAHAAQAAHDDTLRPQHPGTLAIRGAVPRPVTLDAAALARLPRRTVRLDREGTVTDFEGVPVTAVLEAAGFRFDTGGNRHIRTSYVVVESLDGYQVVFAMGEFDPVLSDRAIIVADRRDGRPLRPAEGPFRIVVGDERHGARSARMVTSLTVRSVE